MTALVQSLRDGPLDLVGDVHGHLATLRALLARLGYDTAGRHPAGRHLVFVGDLIDRGEDSPGVYRLVRALAEAGRAQLVLGNHELNVLLGKRREGNEWFHGLPQRPHARLLPQRSATAALRAEMLAYFRTLPLVLERGDLRVVHACWHPPAVAAAACARDTLALFDRHRGESRAAFDASASPAARAVAEQNGNPVSVLTSGLEGPVRGNPFWAGGKLRHTARVPWWESYRDRPAVVFGHYWRSPLPYRPLKAVPGPFATGGGREPFAPLGPRRNAWCIDFCAGFRSEELQREPWRREPRGRLVALRWPEAEIV